MAAPKLTQSAQEALQQAQSEAIRRDHQELQPEHLLFALLSGGRAEEGGTIVPDILEVLGAQVKSLHSKLEQLLGRLPKVSGGSGQVYASPHFNRLIVLAEDEAKKFGDEYVSGEHFLLALLQSALKDTPAAK